MCEQIAWAAGIIEGEAWIGTMWYKDKTWGSKGCVSVSMSDKDVIDRLYAIFNVGNVNRKEPRHKHWKVQWLWRVYKQADVVMVLQTILPFLGERRTEAANGVLALIANKDPNWRNNPRRRKNV